jgi:hypothetical protein
LENYLQDLINGTSYVNVHYLYWGKDEQINKLTEISGTRPDNIGYTSAVRGYENSTPSASSKRTFWAAPHDNTIDITVFGQLFI